MLRPPFRPLPGPLSYAMAKSATNFGKYSELESLMVLHPSGRSLMHNVQLGLRNNVTQANPIYCLYSCLDTVHV